MDFVVLKVSLKQTAINICKTFAPDLYLKRYALQRKNELYTAILSMPEEVLSREENPDLSVSKIGIKKEASKCLNEFIKVMKNNPYANIGSFCKLCTPFSIIYVANKQKGVNVIHGFHDVLKGTIEVDKDGVRKFIFHELMHRLTLRKWEDYISCGFHLYKLDHVDGKSIVYSIGEGINEAYTQLLTLKYFSHLGAGSAYPLIIDLAIFLEKVLGREIMERCFFNADLDSLIKEIAKYSSLQEAVNFIKYFDILLDKTYKSDRKIDTVLAGKIYSTLLKMIAKMEIKKVICEMEAKPEAGDEIAVREQAVLDLITDFKLGFKFKEKIINRVSFTYKLSKSDVREINEFISEELKGVDARVSLQKAAKSNEKNFSIKKTIRER